MSASNQEILQELAEEYRQKVDISADFFVQFDLLADGEVYSLSLSAEQPVEVKIGAAENARFIFLLSSETLHNLKMGQISPLTAAGRAHISEPAPLDFRLGEGLALTPEVYVELIEFAQRFFNATSPERVLMGFEHSRGVHGGHAVALFYGQGFRSAWYQLNEGERLNDEGDTNPFPQAFIFLSGQGRAKIGTETITVAANSAYFIPPQTEHIIWNEADEPLTLSFLAWGAGA